MEHSFSGLFLYNEDHSNNPGKYDLTLDRKNNSQIKCDIKLVRSNLVIINLSCRWSFYEFELGDNNYLENSDLG